MPRYTRGGATCGDILINTSDKAISHCGIVVKNKDVIHATKVGILVEDVDLWGVHSDVFRPRSLLPALSEELDRVARRLQVQAHYGKARAGLKSWSGSVSFGSGAKGRIAKYRTRLAIPFSDTAEAIVKNVFCSELVVLCYQLACADENARHFLKLDAKHCLPKNLRSFLKTDLTYWEHVGEIAAP